MNYLLDTCVLSEFTRRKPEGKVMLWIGDVDETRLYLSAITIGEIQRGIHRLPASERKNNLLIWMNNDLIERFGGRILPIDTQTMLVWGALTTRMEQQGTPLSLMDSLIAATGLQNNLIVVTRSVSDFLPCGVQVINPWE